MAFLCRSLLPGSERLRKLSLASLCRLLHHLEDGNLRLCEALFGLLVSIVSAPVAYSGRESSRWLLHAVHLIYAKWGPKFVSPLRLAFAIRSVYDQWPSRDNLQKWSLVEDTKCGLCGGTETLHHVLSNCTYALANGRYAW